MQYIFHDKKSLKKKLSRGFILFLDFDLTLSPLANNPAHAVLPGPTRALVKALARRIAVTIISGRSRADVKKRTKLLSVRYVGNHGADHGQRGSQKGSVQELAALKDILTKFQKLQRHYPALILENKKRSLALNYRALSPLHLSALRGTLKKITAGLGGRGLRAIHDKKTFEVLAREAENKGTAVLRIMHSREAKGLLPVYVGDSKTDEDAFRVLGRGVTIRVGRSKKSAARFYLRDQTEVADFLAFLLAI